jgi:hypothetical protein
LVEFCQLVKHERQNIISLCLSPSTCLKKSRDVILTFTFAARVSISTKTFISVTISNTFTIISTWIRAASVCWKDKRTLILIHLTEYRLNLLPLKSWSCSYGSLIYNCLCNQCLSPLMLWIRMSLRRCVLDTTSCDQVCQWHAAGRWFSHGTPISSTNKTDRHDIQTVDKSIPTLPVFPIYFILIYNLIFFIMKSIHVRFW